MRALVVLSGVIGAIAVLALIATVALARLEIIQSRHSSCVLLRQVVLLATPPRRISKVQFLLTKPPLVDCNQYAGGFIP